MKTRTLSLLFLSLFPLFTACSSLTTIVSSSGEQPTPEVVVDGLNTSYQPITIGEVDVEIGVGSPIPVYVKVSGNLPDPCSQVEHTEIKLDGSTFNIKLFATPDIGGPALDGCIKDPLPFVMSIPLNVVDLPAGSYTVIVNGASTDFELETGNTTSTLRSADLAIIKNDIQVDDVSMNIGVGSPIPVYAVVSGSLSSVCAQLSEVRIHRDGFTYFIRLVEEMPAEEECTPDTLPFRFEVLLNVVGLEEGTYTVTVNGVETTFEFPIQ